MKNIFKFLAAAMPLTLVFAACTDNPEPETDPDRGFSAYTEPMTPQGSGSGIDMLWNVGDEVVIWDSYVRAAARYKAMQNGSTAAKLRWVSGDINAGPYVAVAPASIFRGHPDKAKDLEQMYVVLPETQHSATGSLAGMPMAATSSTRQLNFHNLCGMVRLHLTKADVSLTRIMITADQYLSGKYNIDFSNPDSPALSYQQDGIKTITLNLSAPQSIADGKDFEIYLPAGSYGPLEITMVASNGVIRTKTMQEGVTIERGKIATIAFGEEELDFTIHTGEGALPGLFSVSATARVNFSQGNLRYQPATGIWRFADHQYEVVGADNTNIATSYSGWIDLFGWGTSGCYKSPCAVSYNSQDYGFDGNDISGTIYDWGVFNAIQNGGAEPYIWRTLTYNEWAYLFNTREDADQKWGDAVVCGVNGVVLLPDTWVLPEGVTFHPGAVASPYGGFNKNTYNENKWAKMEAAGAVFLPAAGKRSGTDIYYVNEAGYYWSSTSTGTPEGAHYLWFISSEIYLNESAYTFYGYAVRLVQDNN